MKGAYSLSQLAKLRIRSRVSDSLLNGVLRFTCRPLLIRDVPVSDRRKLGCIVNADGSEEGEEEEKHELDVGEVA